MADLSLDGATPKERDIDFPDLSVTRVVFTLCDVRHMHLRTVWSLLNGSVKKAQEAQCYTSRLDTALLKMIGTFW